jgi:hypothetical protein
MAVIWVAAEGGHVSRRSVMAVAVVGGAATAYGLLTRPWHLRWGSTDEETGDSDSLPGDEFISHPSDSERGRHLVT